MPLMGPPTGKRPQSDYCQHCTDENGNLKPREEVKAGIAGWFMSWQGEITQEQAMKRAEHFMKAMPAWAKD